MKKTFSLHFTLLILPPVCYKDKPELLKFYFTLLKYWVFLWNVTIFHRNSASAAVAGQHSLTASRMRRRSSKVSGFFRGSRSSAAG